MRASLALLYRGMATVSSARNYAAAIDALNSLQSNAAVIEAIRKSGGKGGEAQMIESVEYLKRIGYTASDLDLFLPSSGRNHLNRLNVLHITGTKGKGSTSAFTSSLLTTLAPGAKVGLYTSPHLVAVRERIRINGQPIAEETFAKYFWEVWDKLEADKQVWRICHPLTPEKPAYFRYLTIMAFHVFLQEQVDATVLEVGVGGTYDSTNVVPQPIVTGVTPLGIDHIFVLGKTIPEIAHQKGGIYKPGVPALAIEQPAEGLDVLRSRAAELKASTFTVVPEHPQLRTVQLGLAGAHQRSNASLALAIAQTFLSSPRLPPAFCSAAVATPHPTPSPENSEPPALPLSLITPTPLPPKVLEGLVRTRWPGRCQVASDPTEEKVTWYLDGAHTIESLQCCGEWFGGAALSSCVASAYRVHRSAPDLTSALLRRRSRSATRILIFNCTSGRSGLSLLGTLLSSLAPSSTLLSQPFHHVVFCTNTTYSSDLTSSAVDAKDLETLAVQRELAGAWEELTTALPAARKANVHVLGSIQEAVELVRGQDGETQVLVTGSLHLVGGVMAVADLPL
ncbi:SPOSA6832_02278, partial [Sporobolomyces salmonicolor]